MRYLTQISSIIVALVFLYTLNFKSLITVDFYLNQVELAELFCINKEKPQLKCNGKCHLSKELSKTETEDSTTPFSQNNTTELNLELILEAEKNDNSKLTSTADHQKWFITIEEIISRTLEVYTPPPQM